MSTITKESILYAEKDMVHELTPQGNVIEDKRNGYGYLLFEPDMPVSPSANGDTISGCVSQRFLEMPRIMQKALDTGSVLLEGKPGAGKSNILQDFERCSRFVGTPVLKISVHINAGTTRTIEETVHLLENYQERFRDIGSVLLVDNVDYGGYKGKKRTRKNALQYAEAVLPVLTKAVEDTGITAIGTAHDELWRQNKWEWSDPLINKSGRDLLEAFSSRYEFAGDMSEHSLRELLEHRSGSANKAEEITSRLGELGLLSFYYGNHIDPDEFLKDERSALNAVEEGRKKRYGYTQEPFDTREKI